MICPRAARSSRPLAPARLGRAAGWLSALALLVAVLARVGSAAESGKTITIGESNTPPEREQLLRLFQATDEDRVEIITVDDTRQAMAGIFDMAGITTAYSSTALTCRDLGDGLDVTTSNITRITPGLYAMALVTAGIGDATLVVAAPNGRIGVEGMTALAGVFQTWDLAPCASGNTTAERQRLALEELTLTAEIGTVLGVANGVQLATDLVLEVQKTIVTEGLKTEAEIDAVVAAQERTFGVAIPTDQRDRLVDLMVRLARANIDWGTFSAGWTIETNADNTRITMRGEGIAIRNAQATATARAGAILTATAEAGAALTATAGAELTATAGAQLTATAEAALTATAQAAQATADAQATEDAIAALTATAEAQPTSTPIPSPTATPEPIPVSGKIVSTDDGSVTVEGAEGAAPQTFTVTDGTEIVRDGENATLDDLAVNDSVDLFVDPATNAIKQATAMSPASPGMLARIGWLTWLLPAALILPPLFWFRRRSGLEPFIVREAAV